MSMGGTTQQGDDEFVVFVAAIVALAALVGSLGLWWDKATGWLTSHGVLVRPVQDPLVVIVGTGGAGLDSPRLAVLAGVVLAFVGWGVSAVRRRLAARRAEQ